MKSVFAAACTGCVPVAAVLIASFMFEYPLGQSVPERPKQTLRTAPSSIEAVQQAPPTRRARLVQPPLTSGIEFSAVGRRPETPPRLAAQQRREAQPAPSSVPIETEVVATATGKTQLPEDLQRRALERATGLRDLSRDAFDRGLMPLSDFSDRLNVSLRIRMKTSEGQTNADTRAQTALADHIRDLQAAAGRLERLGQPSSAGWAGDVTYAKLLVANASLMKAEHLSEQSAAAKLARESRALAVLHFRQREADFAIGLATLPQMSRAAAHLNPDGRNMILPPRASGDTSPPMSAWRTYRDRLERIATRTSGGTQRGAGFGRDDYLQSAKFELSRINGMISAATGNQRAAARAFVDADQFAGQAFDSRMKFFSTGTADLASLTSSWQARSELHNVMKAVGLPVPGQSSAQRRADLGRLSDVASGIRDPRGRNAADVSMVHGLKSLQEMRATPGKAIAAGNTRQRQTVPQSTGAGRWWIDPKGNDRMLGVARVWERSKHVDLERSREVVARQVF